MSWHIKFEFPEGQMWAGWCGNGTLGYAPTIRTAARFESEEIATRTLENTYGDESRKFGIVVRSAMPAKAV